MQRHHSYYESSGKLLALSEAKSFTCRMFLLVTAATLVMMTKHGAFLYLISYVAGQYQPLILDQQQTLSKVALPAACTLPLPPSTTPPSRPPSGDAALADVTAAC